MEINNFVVKRILYIDKKILEVIATLISVGMVRSEYAFCTEIGLKNLNNIKSGKVHFTPVHIEIICNIYSVNAN